MSPNSTQRRLSVAKPTTQLEIVRATTDIELDHARHLMQAFVAWHRSHHAADIALINRYFDAAAFAQELAGLPGHYAPPHGALLIAYHRGQPAGCVALRNLGFGICEMKRMFVADGYRALGIGRALAERAIVEATAIGYRAMRLDTSRQQAEAIRLYEGLGFQTIPPYYPLSAELEDWLLFFEREL
ncbi:GNAT family N-acetyltransferase [Dongia sp.]|uniref:GNAT family N-acetyltransferase n=1 Tax=Dongia sp. TaxID=1977262 RepID=UPI0035B331EF